MEALTLRGEKHTRDTLLLAAVTTQGVDFEAFDGVKGKVRIILSIDDWDRLKEYISGECERLKELKTPKGEEAHTGDNII
jgi:hypothetical protein